MMRILVFTPNFLPLVGGAEIGIYEIFRRLARRHKICVLTPQKSSAYMTQDAYYNLANLEIVRFEDRVNLQNMGLTLKGIIPPFSFSAARVYFHTVRRFKPDIVNIHYAFPFGFVPMIVRPVTHVPFVLSLVGRDIPYSNTLPLKRQYIKVVSKFANDTIFISQFCRTTLYGKSSKHGCIIPFGVDLRRFSPTNDKPSLRRQLGLPIDKLILFSLQRMDFQKRIDIQIKSMQYISQRFRNVVLIIGGKGPDKDRLMTLVQECNLERNVLFKDYIPTEQLPQYFAAADIFAFHSTYETFGVVLPEAMASGIPIVSVNSTAIPELIYNEVNGLIVEPLNPEQFANAVMRLIVDEELRIHLSSNCRRIAQENYSWDEIANRHEELFEAVVSKY